MNCKREGESLITELALIQRARRGDADALEKLIHHYYNNIFSYLFRKVGNITVAEDLTQDVFLRLTGALPHYRFTGKFSNFLFTIAVNVGNDFFRKNKMLLYEDLSSLNIDADIDIEQILIEKEAHGHLKEAIKQLPDLQKDAILLRYFHDMKIKDIARVTDSNVSTVKSRIQQGIKKLKIILSEVESD